MDGTASSGGVLESNVHESNNSHTEDNAVPDAARVKPSVSSDVVAVDLGASHASAIAAQPDVDSLVSVPDDGDNAAGSVTSLAIRPVSDENVDRLFDSPATLVEPSRVTSLNSSFNTSSTGHGSPVAQSDMPQSEEQSADHSGYPDTQVSGPKPLQVEPSFASTIPDEDTVVGAYSSEEQVASQLTGDISAEEEVAMHADNANGSADQEHLPEPPASPTSNTLLSTSSSSTHGEPSQSQASTAVSKGGRVPSANRLSISYAGGSRRLVVNAEVVESLKVYRSDGRIDVCISLEKDKSDGLKGILVGIFVYIFSYPLSVYRLRGFPTRRSRILHY